MAGTKDTIRKFILTGALVVDCPAGKFSVPKACIFLSRHRWLDGCDLDSERVALSILQLALMFARQVLEEELSTTAHYDVL